MDGELTEVRQAKGGVGNYLWMEERDHCEKHSEDVEAENPDLAGRRGSSTIV